MRLALAALIVLVLPAGADAAVRHASPGGASSGNCIGTPCSFPRAVAVAQDGDDVAVAPGDYGSEANPIGDASSGAAIRVHGIVGKPRPRIVAAPEKWALSLGNPNSSVSHLQVTAVGSAPSTATLQFAGSASDMVIVSRLTKGGAACSIFTNAVMTSSLCLSAGPESGVTAIRVDPGAAAVTLTLRNVTAVQLQDNTAALGMYTKSGAAVTVNAINTILKGPYAVGVESNDDGGTATFRPTWSNMAGVHYVESGGCCTEEPSDTNLAASALFVAPTANFHEDPMSPTVNRGLDAAANGAADFDGQPRRIGGRTDIGADELLYPGLAFTGPPAKIKPRSATLTGRANPRGLGNTRARFELGRTKAYGLTTSEVTLAKTNTDQVVTRSPGGLKPGTRYHYRLVVSGPGGVRRGGDRTFVTKPAG